MNFTRCIRNSAITRSFKLSSRTISSARQTPAEWIRDVLEDRTESPRLYAWTLANLPNDAFYSDKSPPVKAVRRLDDEHRRIYILGVGNIGRLYASLLAKNTPRPPITLVVHRRELLEHWRSQPGIELVRAGGGGAKERSADFEIEWWTEAAPDRGPVAEPAGAAAVRNLVVATKAADALPTVDRLRRYLDARSAVAFVQNGMCRLWPPLGDAYAAARFPDGSSPDWLACVTTHGVTSLGPFRSLHASPADVLVGNVKPAHHGGGGNGGGTGDKTARPSDYLTAQIVSAPGLAGRRVDTRDLWVAQLEKLVVNSVINPLTAVLRCKNGELFEQHDQDDNDNIPVVIDALLDEASATLQALVTHPSSDGILQAAPSFETETQAGEAGEAEALEAARDELLARFSTDRLRNMLRGVAARVAANTSSMLQDVRAGRHTEVRHLNGWLVDAARYYGVGEDARLPVNEMLVRLVEDGVQLDRGELCRRVLGRG
ncbi:6-phosphogluconate dehydrogenase C-terminal domain-like protein [Hypoxylon sp. FL1284]|nr:6-phosphogluconate dehydrogenase C-terminal domain-like protein [Hypoxylon sp. FL1284]